jgi:hypothetical protein
MEFASPDELQEFLALWLEDHGHSVHRHVTCDENYDIDILTQAYTIECQPILTPTSLWTAADALQLCQAQFPEQQPVIAGLSPEETEETRLTLEEIKKSGIEVWFIDQMPPFLTYYNQLGPPQPSPDQEPAEKTYQRRSPLAGCFISIGMAAILTTSFWIAYRILDQQEMELAANSQEGQAWDNLHQAVAVWDLDTAREHLQTLEKSRSACIATFAERLDNSLQQQGAEGFRDINPIKRALNQQEGCSLEMRDYEFSP